MPEDEEPADDTGFIDREMAENGAVQVAEAAGASEKVVKATKYLTRGTVYLIDHFYDPAFDTDG